MQTAAALLIKNLGKSILGEGSEELFTELANAAADTLIMGDLSDYNLAVRQYRAQGESEEEARRHAGWDVAKQAGLAFAGGGLMGFGSAAGGMAYNGAANRYAAPRAVESGSFYNALQYGLAQGEDTAAGRLARELAGRDTASRADVMRMLRAAESRQAEGGPGAQTLVDPQLYTRAVPFPVSWTVKMKKKQKETQDILSYHSQAAGCSDKARAKASGGRQPIEECGRTGL